MSQGGFTRAGQLLSGLLANVAKNTGSGAALGPVWRDVVGEAIFRNARPVRLERGVLTVECDGPAWHDALLPQRAALVEKLARAVGGRGIVSIELVIR